MAGARRGARGAQPPLLGRDRRPPAAVAHGDRLRAARGARAPRAPRSSSPQAPPWQAARALHLQPHLQPRLHPAPQATPPASQPTEAARARRSASHASIRCRGLHAQWRRRECLPSAPLVNTSSVRLRLARGQWPARTRLRGLVVAREWRCIMWVALWAASSRRDAATTLGWVQCSPGEKNYVLGVHRRLSMCGTAAAAHVCGRQSWRRAPPAAPRRACPRGDPRAARRRAPRAAPRGGRGRGRRCGANACVRRLAAQRRGSCAASPKELRMLRVHPTGALGVGVACSAQRGSQRGGREGARSLGWRSRGDLPARARPHSALRGPRARGARPAVLYGTCQGHGARSSPPRAVRGAQRTR